MSVADLLKQSVMVAGEEVKPQIGTMSVLAAELKTINPALLTNEEKRLLKVAEATKESLPLINIASAIKVAGAGPDGLPRLAIASYEMSMGRDDVTVAVRVDGSLEFYTWMTSKRWSIKLPAETLPKRNRWFLFETPSLCRITSIPLVPLALRQNEQSDVVLLYEVIDWKRLIVVPGDPYLLRHIAGYVYAILGSWDISQRELDVYQGARNLGL